MVVSVQNALLCACLLFLSACSGINILETDKPSASLAQMNRYAWAAEPVTSDSLMARFDQLVKQAVDAELAARGYQRVEARTAEFLVDYRFSEIEAQTASVDMDGSYDGWTRDQAGSRFVGWSDDPGMSEYPMGVLNLAFLSADTKAGLWEIYAGKMLDEKRDLANMEANVNRVVKKLFANFAPRAQQ